MKLQRLLCPLSLLLSVHQVTAATPSPAPPAKTLPLPGEVFSVAGRTAFVILPTGHSQPGTIPWVWYAPTLAGLPNDAEKWMFEKFTAAGLAIAGIDVGESYGSPDGRRLFSALYQELTEHRHFSKKPVLLARSRGGLMLYNWAAEHPEAVGGIAGIYPVCNLMSYPGLDKACGAYGFTAEELKSQLTQHNPVDRLAPLAQARVPILHIHGDVDKVVPFELNTGLVESRYRELGGDMKVITAPGQGHNMWPGFFQCQELTDFVIRHASPWKNGPPFHDPHYFPIAVWLQNPRNAERFKAAGINLYVGLWRGPTTNQLADLQAAGMPVICAQNQTALAHKDHPIIVGWMHDDEPDNAQSLGSGKGYGPPIPPSNIVRDYERIRAADPTRPVLLNLGQGVAYDNYIGRGVRRNHPEDYPEYVQGCDIASFDIYPVVHDKPEVAGKLEFVARGVGRLVQWTGGTKGVWNCVECTHISNEQIKASPAQVRAEVWMALIHGSRGLIYFVHQFKPAFKEAALLDDPEMLAAVTAINRRIHELAPALNSPTLTNAMTVTSSNPDAPIAWMVKRMEETICVFTVNMRPHPTRASFALEEALKGLAGPAKVLDESREIALRGGIFEDDFQPYAVHLYELALARQ